MADDKDIFDEADTKNKGNGRGDDDIRIEVLDTDDTPPSAVEFAAGPGEDIPELERQLDALRKEKEEIYDRLLRKHADFENYRKRAEKDKQDFRQFALSELMSELIFILDNFERALAHGENQAGTEYRKGVELIYRQFRDLLEKRGLKAIESIGRPFDPNFHEAVIREERNDLPENTILEELQKGYLFNNRLLRAAMVKVSYRSDEQQAGTQSSEQGTEQTTKNEQSGDGWESNES